MTDITRGSGNVFEDLGLENADELKRAADKITESRKKALKMLDSLRKTAKSSKFADGNEDRYAETIRKALQAMECKDTITLTREELEGMKKEHRTLGTDLPDNTAWGGYNAAIDAILRKT